MIFVFFSREACCSYVHRKEIHDPRFFSFFRQRARRGTLANEFRIDTRRIVKEEKKKKYFSRVCHVTLNDVTEANRKPSKRRYNPSYRSKSSCDVICAVESRASCTQRRDRGRINCKSAIKVFLFHSKKSSRLNRRDTIVVNFFRSRVPFFKFLRSLTYNTTYNEIIARRRLTRRRFP